MTPDLIDAARIVTDALGQFAYGPIDPETTPYMGQVELTVAQYRALKAIAALQPQEQSDA